MGLYFFNAMTYTFSTLAAVEAIQFVNELDV
jgi:hypothetical protein